MSETIHVLPVNDLKPHVESDTYCHCQPEVRQEEGGQVVVHNEYDGREFFEDDEVEGKGH